MGQLPFHTLLALSLGAWGGAPAAAHAGGDWKLLGSVRDAVSGEPIEGAEIKSEDLRVVTDPQGAFELTLASDTAALQIEAAGYLGTQIGVTIGGVTGPMEIALILGTFS